MPDIDGKEDGPGMTEEEIDKKGEGAETDKVGTLDNSLPQGEGMTSTEIDIKGKGAVRLDTYGPADIAKFGKGAVDSQANLRLLKFGEYAGKEPFDWVKGFDLSRTVPFTINDQGASLSCTGQAWSKYIAILNFIETKKYTDFSARFIYARTWIPPEGGAWLFSGGDLVTLAGIPTEGTTPSYRSARVPLNETEMRVRDDRPETLKEALAYRTKAPAYVNGNIEEMARAIRDQSGMIFGFVGTNEGMVTGGTGVVRPPAAGEVKWGHAVLAVGAGMINGKKYIKWINSWSEKWGQFGFGYIGEDYIATGHTFDGLTLIDLPNSSIPMTEHDINQVYSLAFYRLPTAAEVAFWKGKDFTDYLNTAVRDRAAFLNTRLAATPPAPPSIPAVPVPPTDLNTDVTASKSATTL